MAVMSLNLPAKLAVAIKIVHYAFPALVFLYFVVALTVTVCTLQTQSLRIRDQHVRRNVMISLILAVSGTYIVQAIAVLISCLVDGAPEGFPEQDYVVYLLGCIIVFGVQALALTDTKFPVWYPYHGTWFLGILVELALLVVPNVFSPPNSIFDVILIIIQVLRVKSLIILTCLYFGLRNDKKKYENTDAERQSLLRKKLAPRPSGSEESGANGNGYGATATDANTQSETADDTSEAESADSWIVEQREAQDLIEKRLKQDGNWFTYAKGFSVFFPYIWPVHDKSLQFRAVLVGGCLLATNVLNVAVPNQLGVMIDSLKSYVEDKDTERNIWLPVATYGMLLFISSPCISWLRKWLWMPIEQYSYDALSTASHAHLMSLSSDFHDSKTSSDLTQAIHGGRSVSDLLETVCFQVVPMFIDLAVAFGYLWLLFGPYMGFIMAVTVISYLYITTKLVALRAEKRRDYVTIYRKEWTIGQQSLDGWSTASLFNMIPWERQRYSSAVKQHMKAKRTFELSSQFIGAAQGLVMTFGLLGALYLGVYQVSQGYQTIGKFTTLLVYWAQLQSPLVFFSNMYRSISYSLMDAERLLGLFQTKPTIVDLPHAKPLKLAKGLVKFDRVSFAYDDRKPTLKDVSFVVPAGKTVALVGETGGGKTTILKLIHRFYDVKSGGISIDGQDLRDVTLESLRDKIGVVPQDPVLFNDSIMNNVRYARITASDKDVYDACKAAAVHDKIMTFPDGYNSKVGDRGVKLSGGEKQRVAIARAILKQPDIILLDEATSAVDTDTEHLIQEGFKTLCKDRTTFIVAHRLSTIMRADRILVVMNGQVIEEGTHEALIHSKGKYHDLWSKQIFVKPLDERSRSRSPKKHDADIINDLTPNRQRAELAKVMKTTSHKEPSQEPAKVPARSEEQKPIGGGGTSSHKREGSKLKPDAPEFVPLQSNPDPRTPTKTDSKAAAKAQKKQEKEQKKGSPSVAKKSTKSYGKRVDGADDSKDSTGDDSVRPVNKLLTEGDISGTDKPKPKRARYSRRHWAKSEPAGRLDESVDGTQDSDITAVGSSEGQSLLQSSQSRRVSAPVDQPSVPSNSRGPRPRRDRHWRLKNRAAESTGSGSASSVMTSDEMAATAHAVTLPSEPAQSTSTTVKFAPGF